MNEGRADNVGRDHSDLNDGSADPVPDLDRRRFVTGAAATAAAAGAATLAFPMIAPAAEPITLKFQSTWPADDIFHEFAQDYGRTVNDMSGGRLRLNVLPNRAVSGALGMLDAVGSGALDGGHGVAAYGYDKHKAYALFGIAPSFGWDANTFLGWVKYGGGQGLYDELVQKILRLNLVGFLAGPMPSQPLGWFKREVKTVGDLKNLKFRTSGLAADVMREMGLTVVQTGSDEIVPAMKRGALDAAEFNNPSSDRTLGFPEVAKVYMLRSYHTVGECFEIVFNRKRYESLPAELQVILRYAADAFSSDMSWKAMDRYSKDLQTLETQYGVKVHETPEAILKAELEAWDRVIAKFSKDPFFARVIQSQKAWNRRVVGFQLRNEPSRELAYGHFFKA
jgi:TRAP-type mannitol/chloroaromatic compound transport system substrate-binding protein